MGKAAATYIASLLLFGTNGIVASFIPLASAQIVMLRTLIGAAFLGAALLLSHSRLAGTPLRQLAFVAASGVSTGLSWVTLYEAYRLVGVGVSSLIYYCAPVVVMLLSRPLFGERFTARKTLGFSIVLAGTVLVGAQSLQVTGSPIGIALAAISALCHAGMVIFSKFAPDVSGTQSSFIQLTVSCAIASAFALATGGFSFLGAIPHDAWLPIIVLGMANTGAGCAMYFSSITKLPAQTVATLGYLEPLSAVVFSVILLSEPFTALQWLGAVMVIGGAVASELPSAKGIFLRE